MKRRLRRRLEQTLVLGGVLGVCLGAGSSASAAPIAGQIGFTGDYVATPAGPFQDITGLSFPASSTESEVKAANGSFLPILGLTGDFFNSFTFDPAGGVTEIWKIVNGGTTYSYDADTISVDFHDSTNLVLSAIGTLHVTGLEDMEATWTFSADAQQSIFIFSSISAVNPEPGSAILFMVGAAVCAASMRRTPSA